ncbi:MAG: ATP synthase F1 subunit gamma [Schleiferiaceae bacterium]|jgi:F-type H+-transporting ATPase subunit gamma|nr:ATP synthase F1 subunit gamma [Flavobacteriales bacterium]MDG1005610.1 ATP synthase F1 subunit gamma [Schleiferiaceae bacterium]NCF57518.1 ATP synthase F1 subunit gamma [Bacteroidota bacterium]NCG43688.1 ATP synthase F1 subunit gamma [Pseudomonadota bacterium]MBT3572132.1 ATP synthase F1 subunit gamma [Flavobacteriales bacterium]
MANLKELRNRIASVSSTMQITSAMKMVSAAKLKRAQDAIIQMRPYAQKLSHLMSNVNASFDDSENPYAIERPLNKVLVIPITSNRGLCGGFNSSVIKRTLAMASAFDKEGVEVEVYALGKKGREMLAKTLNVVNSDVDAVATVTFDSAKTIAEAVMSNYSEGSYDRVVLVYNQFKNAAVQLLQEETMLPIASPDSEQSNGDYIFDPSKAQLLNELIPSSIKSQMFKALLDSQASEQGARMTAMHKATDNATDLRDGLKLKYNKARQAAITNEILEIVGGAEALNG